jgi:hypothetical protein
VRSDTSTNFYGDPSRKPDARVVQSYLDALCVRWEKAALAAGRATGVEKRHGARTTTTLTDTKIEDASSVHDERARTVANIEHRKDDVALAEVRRVRHEAIIARTRPAVSDVDLSLLPNGPLR